MDRILRASAGALTLAVILTGLVAWLLPSASAAPMWVVFVHTAIGFVFAVWLPVYLVHHYRRVVGLRRPWTLLGGWVVALTAVGFTGTGVVLAVIGHVKATASVHLWHIALGVVATVAVVVHVVQHVKGLPARRRETAAVRDFADLGRQFVRPGVYAGLASFATALLLAAATPAPRVLLSDSAAVEPYSMRYGDHPFRPSQTESPDGKFVHVDAVAGSHTCATCHTTIAAQWARSTHRRAAADPAYVKNVNLLESRKGTDATRYCEGCHAPIALLSGELTAGGKHGGTPGTPAFDEGVSCMTCHGIDRVVHTKGVASYSLTPRRDYVFDGFEEPLASLNRLSIRLRPAQHKEDVGRAALRTSELCATCHSQFMDVDMNGWGWVKMQDEYSAWRQSHYSGMNEGLYRTAEVTACRDCHMPLTPAPEDPAASGGMVRSHAFAAANTLIALAFDEPQQLAEIKQFLRQAKIRVEIDVPQSRAATQNRLALEEPIRDAVNTPWYYYLGERATVDVIVSNIGVGHDFPGGTIDINEAWLAFSVHDATGAAIYESGAVGADGAVDPKAVFFKGTATDRFGKEVWRHDLFNMTGESYRRVVKAGASDLARYEFTVPGWATPPLQMTATVQYRKLNNKYARWALADDYIELPVIDVARTTRLVPLRVQPNAGSLGR